MSFSTRAPLCLALFAAIAFAAPALADDTGPGEQIQLFDPSGRAMEPLHKALRRADAGVGQARLLVYGASHVASDTFTGRLRQLLQDRFGDSGHGFVLPAKPWRSYRHSDVNIDGTLTWWGDWVSKTGERGDGYYGLAGVSIASSSPDDYASLQTTEDNGHGRKVSRFDIYYLEQPGGGSLDVRIDGRLVRRVSTAGLLPTAGYATFDVSDGAHQLELFPVGDGEVRLFGVAMDRAAPGVILDAVGVNGHRAQYWLQWNAALQVEHIRRRSPDLIVLAYGTNESGDDDDPIDDYTVRLREVVGRARQAAPEAACLLIGPSDRPVREGRKFLPRPRTAQLIDAQKRVSAEYGCAFFDVVEFMGGPMSMVDWVAHDPPYASQDHVHFTSRGYDHMGEVLYEALLEGFSATADLGAPRVPAGLD
jgi:lysophospholipase L1-like esterase